jgi:transcriptional regulator NrdR family protein
MMCPRCGRQTAVVDSRQAEGNRWRRRACACGNIFETRENLVDHEEYLRIRCLVDKLRPVRKESFATISCGVRS